MRQMIFSIALVFFAIGICSASNELPALQCHVIGSLTLVDSTDSRSFLVVAHYENPFQLMSDSGDHWYSRISVFDESNNRVFQTQSLDDLGAKGNRNRSDLAFFRIRDVFGISIDKEHSNELFGVHYENQDLSICRLNSDGIISEVIHLRGGNGPLYYGILDTNKDSINELVLELANFLDDRGNAIGLMLIEGENLSTMLEGLDSDICLIVIRLDSICKESIEFINCSAE